ncbi:MAG: T9SS C-terminal target domain-containing protein [Candidatus Zixiibacteriota bacterium]|nr:MAG: T9SS C-terminal target domain-containing protein [candidate division Zixibacteria bacterium]
MPERLPARETRRSTAGPGRRAWRNFTPSSFQTRSAIPAWAVILAALLLAAGPAAADFPDDVTILRNDAQGVTLRYTPQAPAWKTLSTPQQTYKTPLVGLAEADWASGTPNLPARVIWLAIPAGSVPTLTSVTPFSVETSPGLPAPVPRRDESSGRDVYEEDPQYYAGTTVFPAAWAELEAPEPFRDLYVVRVALYPYRFSPAEGQILFLDSVEVQIHLEGGSAGAGKFSRPLDDQFYQGLIANWSGPAQSWKLPRAFQTQAGDSWPEGDLYKVQINGSGMYRLTYQDLDDAGIDVDALDPRTLRLFNNGGRTLPKNMNEPRAEAPLENAILVKGEEDGSFDPGDEIWFYGRSVHDWEWNTLKERFTHYRNPYTDYNIYWLNVNPGGTPGKRMATLGMAGTPTLNPATTRAYLYDEKEIYITYSSLALPQNMPDFFGDAFTNDTQRTFSFFLEDVNSATPGLLSIKFKYYSGTTHFTVYLNNEVLFTTSSTTYEKVLPAGLLHTGNNVLKIVHTDPGTAYLDWYEIEYTRNLNASGGELAFISPAATGLAGYQISGLANPWIFDVTSFDNLRAVQASSFKDSSHTDQPRRYMAVTPAEFRSPMSITRDVRGGDEYTSLRSTLGADLLIICADEFYAAMEEYETYREVESPQPMDVLRVRISDIFDEYGWGLVDPAAIRDFLKSTLPLYNWAVSPLYVIFAGDGDFDYKNRLSSADANWVIPFVSGSRCTDDWYSYFTPTDNGSAYPQLVTGRWPARSVDDIQEMIDRVRTYESLSAAGPWQDLATFVADDEYGDGGVFSVWEKNHTIDLEYIAENYIPGVLNKKKIYLTEYPVTWDPAGGGRRKPGANEELIQTINDGTLIVNYIGHGNPTVWAHEQVLLQSRDMPLVNNGDKLSLFVAWTCEWAYWDSPYDQSMPEALLTMPGGGAIMTLAATRETYSGANEVLANKFFTQLFSQPGGLPVGQALMQAKASVYQHKAPNVNPSNYNNERYHLLGDPTLKLAMPQLAVQFDSAATDTLHALERVTVSGEVRTTSGTPVPDFDGTANLQVYDTRVLVTYIFPNESTTTYKLPGSLIFRGNSSVTDGRFESSFVVPVDINYGGAGGRFSVFAYSEAATAGGADDNVIFAQTAANLSDSLPPAVSLYFDSPAYRPGAPVASDAIVFVQVADSNGVNLTGSVGHGITVSFDGQNPLDLTNAFTYDLDSYTTGRAAYQLTPGELAPGPHTALATAWDAANNPNTAEISFEVIGSGELRVTDVLNYPNPFHRTTNFTFWVTEPAVATIKVYTVSGKLVKVIRDVPAQEFTYDNPTLVWDGRDQQGDLISNGVYLYKVTAVTPDGRTAEETGKLVFMR